MSFFAWLILYVFYIVLPVCFVFQLIFYRFIPFHTVSQRIPLRHGVTPPAQTSRWDKMLGICFRIFCGLCDSEVDFRSLGVILVVLGWLLGCVFGVLSCLWSAWAAIWGSFWGSWTAVEVHFGGLGVPLGAFGAQWPSKTRGAFSLVPF